MSEPLFDEFIAKPSAERLRLLFDEMQDAKRRLDALEARPTCRPCSLCHGTGYVLATAGAGSIACRNCNGTGRIDA